MRIGLVGFYDGLYSFGLRKLNSIVKSFYDDTELYLYNVNGYGTYFKEHFFPIKHELHINPDLLKRVVDADVIGVSSLTKHSQMTAEFIRQVRKINPSCYIIWGGAHAIMDPESCISFADAVCVGEGEKPLMELLEKFHTPQMKTVHGFWFRSGAEIVKNPLSPLMTSAEFNTLPYMDFSDDIIYVDNSRVANLTPDIYLSAQGTNYHTIWSQGCPFKCSYCGNTRYLENDKKYAQLRYPSPEYIIGEIKQAVDKCDFITFVEFHDDNFFLIQNEDLIEFAQLYKEQIGLPFRVGLFPGTVREGTLDLFIDAGLRSVCMGIQSGSQRMLDFYERRTSKKKVFDTANLLISKFPRIGPPDFTIIMDNPVENENDKSETLEMLDSLKTPFNPLIYSLRSIPGTNLRKYADAHPEIPFTPLGGNTTKLTGDAKYALRLYLYGLGKPSKLATHLVDFIALFPTLLSLILKFIILMGLGRRVFYHLKTGNFQTLSSAFPSIPCILYKTGLLRLIQPRKAGVLKTHPAFRKRNALSDK